MENRSKNGKGNRNWRNKWNRSERAQRHESQDTHTNRKKVRKLNACTRKSGIFTTQTEAARAASEYNHAYPIAFTPIGEYSCRYCHRWHIGHDRRGLRLEKQRLLEIYAEDICRLLRYSPPLYTRSIGF